MSDRPLVVAVHGVNNGPADPTRYAREWEATLCGEGFPCEVWPATWASTGTISLDVLGLMLRSSWRGSNALRIACVVAWALKQGAALRRPVMVLAHSAGAPMAVAALRHMAIRNPGLDVPIVAVGAPTGHPLWGRALASAGAVGSGPSSYAVDLYNEEDIACALGRRRRDLLGDGWVSVPISFPGQTGVLGEHSDEAYLSHRLTIFALQGGAKVARKTQGLAE